MAGIYLHIPFCRKACHYCDFHFSTSLDYADRMVEAIVRDVEMQSESWKSTVFRTLYFGGGTPSVLTASQLDRMMKAVQEHYRVHPEAEITFEVNPDDVTVDSLAIWKAAGINRFSMGVQSFSEELLEAMNRSHNAQQAREAFGLARDAGFENLSADLIYGQPGQSMESWQSDVEEMLQHHPPHISAYCLTVEQGTALDHFVRKGKVRIPADRHIEDQYTHLCTALREAGYEHYEVSNWALPGSRSQHNSSYWKREAYVGIGPSAHGFRDGRRYWNVANNAAYMKAMESGQPEREEEILSERDALNEWIMTSLRTAEGMDSRILAEKSGSAFQESLQTIQRFQQMGLGDFRGHHFALNEAGMLHADRLASDLFILES